MKAIINLPKTVLTFLREIAAELRAMDWISRKQAVEYTLTVIIATALVVALITGMDALVVAARTGILDRF